jgi:hypothetical protein
VWQAFAEDFFLAMRSSPSHLEMSGWPQVRPLLLAGDEGCDLASGGLGPHKEGATKQALVPSTKLLLFFVACLLVILESDQ